MTRRRGWKDEAERRGWNRRRRFDRMDMGAAMQLQARRTAFRSFAVGLVFCSVVWSLCWWVLR